MQRAAELQGLDEFAKGSPLDYVRALVIEAIAEIGADRFNHGLPFAAPVGRLCPAHEVVTIAAVPSGT